MVTNCFKRIKHYKEMIELREGDRGHKVKMTKVPLQDSLVMGSSWHSDSPSERNNRRVVGM